MADKYREKKEEKTTRIRKNLKLMMSGERKDKLDMKGIAFKMGYLGYSQGEISKVMGVTQPAVSNWFKAHKNKI